MVPPNHKFILGSHSKRPLSIHPFLSVVCWFPDRLPVSLRDSLRDYDMHSNVWIFRQGSKRHPSTFDKAQKGTHLQHLPDR